MKKQKLLLVPMLIVAGSALPFATAQAAPVKLGATLTGPAEVGGGDADGTGSFSAEVDPDAGDFCYTVTSAKIAAPTMAHVHSGAAGANGPPVITLDPKGADLCMAVEPDVLKPILAAPESYYVNVHNAEFPGGAVRGQLMKK